MTSQRVNEEASLQAAKANACASRDDLIGWLEQVGRDADPGAFERLFDHFYPRLCRYMQHCDIHPGEAEELVQDTMVKVWLKAGDYRPVLAAPSTWIFTIARNLRTDRIRKEGVPKGYLCPPEYPDAAQLASEETRADALAILDRLDELPKEQVAVLKMVYLDGLSQAEISERLELPLGTVKSRIRLGFKALRRSLGVDP
ncbi:MAG: sigma-70 family RNA polymerase sigma factor [Sedimenticolaceae bacterium]